jgi:hypothetical protein
MLVRETGKRHAKLLIKLVSFYLRRATEREGGE